MSPATTGEAAVDVLNLNGNRHSNDPSFSDTDTNPLFMKKITCGTPRIVRTTGVACVIISSCDFQTTAPVSLFSANSDSPGPPPPRNTRFPSITGEAALFQPMLQPAWSLIRSTIQSAFPVCSSRQESTRSWLSTYTLPSLTVGVERGPSPPLLSAAP